MELGTVWLDRLPLPAGVAEVRFGLVGEQGRELRFDGAAETQIPCRLAP